MAAIPPDQIRRTGSCDRDVRLSGRGTGQLLRARIRQGLGLRALRASLGVRVLATLVLGHEPSSAPGPEEVGVFGLRGLVASRMRKTEARNFQARTEMVAPTTGQARSSQGMGTNAAAIRAEPIPRPAAKNASDDNFARRSARANRGDGEGGDDIVEGCGEGGISFEVGQAEQVWVGKSRLPLLRFGR